MKLSNVISTAGEHHSNALGSQELRGVKKGIETLLLAHVSSVETYEIVSGPTKSLPALAL